VLLHVNPLMPTVAIRVQLLKHPVPDRVKPSFVISDVRVPGSLVVLGTGTGTGSGTCEKVLVAKTVVFCRN